jgi:hypothetical protein
MSYRAIAHPVRSCVNPVKDSTPGCSTGHMKPNTGFDSNAVDSSAGLPEPRAGHRRRDLPGSRSAPPSMRSTSTPAVADHDQLLSSANTAAEDQLKHVDRNRTDSAGGERDHAGKQGSDASDTELRNPLTGLFASSAMLPIHAQIGPLTPRNACCW